MLRNSRRRLKVDRPLRRHGRSDARVPARLPLVDCPRRHANLVGQLRSRPHRVDSLCNWIRGVHTQQFGTESSDCQAADSSAVYAHDWRMDSDKEAFGKRLNLAFDLRGEKLGVSSKPIDRKRYLSKVTGVGERHAGNYLKGQKMPEPEGLIVIAKALGVSWEWLAIGSGDMLPIYLLPEEAQILRELSPVDRARLFNASKILFTSNNTNVSA